jgi:hypothetical protein
MNLTQRRKDAKAQRKSHWDSRRLRQHRRRGLFVEPDSQNEASSVGAKPAAEDAAPTELGKWGRCGSALANMLRLVALDAVSLRSTFSGQAFLTGQNQNHEIN